MILFLGFSKFYKNHKFLNLPWGHVRSHTIWAQKVKPFRRLIVYKQTYKLIDKVKNPLNCMIRDLPGLFLDSPGQINQCQFEETGFLLRFYFLSLHPQPSDSRLVPGYIYINK